MQLKQEVLFSHWTASLYIFGELGSVKMRGEGGGIARSEMRFLKCAMTIRKREEGVNYGYDGRANVSLVSRKSLACVRRNDQNMQLRGKVNDIKMQYIAV